VYDSSIGHVVWYEKGHRRHPDHQFRAVAYFCARLTSARNAQSPIHRHEEKGQPANTARATPRTQPLSTHQMRHGGGVGLYAHPPMFGDLPLCLSAQRICAVLEYALRKCFPSVPPLSRPHLSRHRRVWGALAIFCLLTHSQKWSTETECRRAVEHGELSKPMNGPAERELRPANRLYGPSNGHRGGGGSLCSPPDVWGPPPMFFREKDMR